LRQRDFIGTESRLNIIFKLLRQMVFGSADDPQLQLSELRRRRAELDAIIARAERGDIVVLESEPCGTAISSSPALPASCSLTSETKWSDRSTSGPTATRHHGSPDQSVGA